MSIKMPLPIKYCYRRRLPHLQKADAALFVTFCTGARLILPDQGRDTVLEHCLREGGAASVARRAWRGECGAGALAHERLETTNPPSRSRSHA